MEYSVALKNLPSGGRPASMTLPSYEAEHQLWQVMARETALSTGWRGPLSLLRHLLRREVPGREEVDAERGAEDGRGDYPTRSTSASAPCPP